MHAEIKKKVLINTLYFLVVGLVFYLILKYVFNWFSPFLFGFIIAYIAETISKRMCSKTKLNKKIASIFVLIVVFVLISVVLVIIIDKAASVVDRYAEMVPNFYTKNIVPILENGKIFFNDIILRVVPKHQTDITSITSFVDSNAEKIVNNVSEQAISLLGTILKNIPQILIWLGFTVLSSIFFVLDYQNIVEFFIRQLPIKARDMLVEVRTIITKSVLKTIKAYLLIFAITCIEISVGLSVLKVENFIAKAVLISFLDFLPLLGLSIGFIPWIILCIIEKNFYLAIGLSVLFFIVTCIRSFIEPRIVGKQVGLNPIVSLICFYFGIRLFGVIGALTLPIIVVVLKQLNEKGKIKLWK